MCVYVSFFIIFMIIVYCLLSTEKEKEYGDWWFEEQLTWNDVGAAAEGRI